MLATSSTGQVDELLAMLLALVTELVKNDFDVYFFEQALRRILQFADLEG